jgi:hypothetical protein
MTAYDNIITTADVVAALDREFIANFRGEYDRFAEILGLFPVETMKAGTALYQYAVSGSLNDGEFALTSDEAVVEGKTYYTRSGSAGAYVYTKVEDPKTASIASYYELVAASGKNYVEGDFIARSKYTLTKTPVGEIEFAPYAKQTTAQAILKGGFENAVLRTDRKMQQQLRAAILNDFFAFLGNGTGTATGVGLQAALAKADAVLGDTMETNGDEPGPIVHFVNRQDAATYLGEATITTQTAFGLTYLENFLGTENVLLTNKVASGSLIVTPVENIHIYGLDFDALGTAGLSYASDDLGLIGVHHASDYDYASAETYAVRGANFMPEITDYIVKGTVAPSA